MTQIVTNARDIAALSVHLAHMVEPTALPAFLMVEQTDRVMRFWTDMDAAWPFATVYADGSVEMDDVEPEAVRLAA